MSTRIAYENLIHGPNVIAVPSSQQTAFPSTSWLTGLISDVLRWKQGWTIVTGINDRIEFNRGGNKVAIIAAGTYATGAAAATALQTALTTADGAVIWSVTYDIVTHKFTITCNATFTLLFANTHSWFYSSAHIDYGYTSRDYAAAIAHVADRPSYQSRHWINIDLGTNAGSGITIVGGANDRIDFSLSGFGGGGPLVATVTPGFYATPAELCTAVITALEIASGPGPDWDCNFDEGTFKFTFGEMPFPLSVYWATGANVARSIGPTLGFNAVDLSGYAYYTSDNVVAGTPQSFSAALVRSHNISPYGTVRFDANATSMINVGLDQVVAFSVMLEGTDPKVAYFSDKVYRYVRFVIDDVMNDTGYAEIGVGFVGPSIEPTGLEAPGFSKKNEQLSDIVVSAGGAHQLVKRRRRRVWTMQWKLYSQAEEDVFDALDLAMPAGSNFFITFDTDNPEQTVYGYLTTGIEIIRQRGELRYMQMQFAEALD